MTAALRPNFFIGIRVAGLRDPIDAIHSRMIQAVPELSPFITSSAKLHLTGFVMHLGSQEEIALAADCLRSCQGAVDDCFRGQREKSLSFSTVGHFPGNVIYLPTDEGAVMDSMRYINGRIREAFRAAGISITDDREWVPHLTLAKRSRSRRKVDRSAFDRDALGPDLLPYPLFSELSVIELLAMGGEGSAETDPLGAHGYYRSHAAIRV